MSFLRFEDHADGVHVFFADVTNPGPLPTVSNFVTHGHRHHQPREPLIRSGSRSTS